MANSIAAQPTTREGLKNEQATVIAVADRRNGQIEPAQ